MQNISPYSLRHTALDRVPSNPNADAWQEDTDPAEGSWKQRRPGPGCKVHVAAPRERRAFVVKLAEALLRFGEPLHQLEDKVLHAASFLGVDVLVGLLDAVVILTFGAELGLGASTHFLKCPVDLSLQNLQLVHRVYAQVIGDRLFAHQGTIDLQAVIDGIGVAHHPFTRAVLCFLAAFSIAPLGFLGSPVDAAISGSLATLSILLEGTLPDHVKSLGVHQLAMAAISAAAARLLNALAGHMICFSATASSAAVLLLPGFPVFQGSLELAANNIVAGATKLTYAIAYALFLSYSMTFGSDIGFSLLPAYRAQRNRMASDLRSTFVVQGNATSPNMTTTLQGTFTFQQLFEPDVAIERYHYIAKGCYREQGWSWLFKPLPWTSTFVLLPIFVLCVASLNGQGWKGHQLWVMVLLGGCSFAVTQLASYYIKDDGSVVGAFGAATVGLMGALYQHCTGRDPLPVMTPGILVLLPAGLSTVGGLSQNFLDPNTSRISWLETGGKLVRVTTAITIGLWASDMIEQVLSRLYCRLRKHA